MDSFRIFGLFLAPTVAFAAPPLVAVDVGHGGKDTGAISARGRTEFEFNRDFAGVLAASLRQRELGVREVNFDGQIGSLAARPLAAAGSDFFIAVHHDSIGEAWLIDWEWNGQPQTYTEVKRGYGIFVSAQNPALETSLRCASTIGAMMRRPASRLRRGMAASTCRPMPTTASGITTTWSCSTARPCRPYSSRPG